MSLFSTIQQGSNALQVAELGLHVVGNNIANAGTPGYLRQEMIQTPSTGVRTGGVIVGTGVRAVGVVQKVDEFVVDRMRQIRSELESSDRLSSLYNNLESIFGEMTDNDLSSQINSFSSSINDVLNQPGNESLRRLVIERGSTLTNNVRTLSQQLGQFATNLNQEVRDSATEINRLTSQIAKLNRRIVEIEGGKTLGSDAVGLRDERLKVLEELSAFADIRAVEQVSGSVTVFVGGEYLVADGIQRPVVAALNSDGEQSFLEVRLADTDSPLEVSAGRLHGIYQARDAAVGEISKSLDQFANDIVEQFNRIHTQGQGSVGFSEVTSVNGTDDPLGALDLAGYKTQIKNGSFQVQVKDLGTGTTTTHDIRIKLLGGTDDSSLEDVRGQLDAISGLSASITPEGKLRIGSDSHMLQFSFQEDNSNFLSAAGINTFFVGDSAATLAINPVVANDPRMLAASLTGIGNGTDNALSLAQAFEEPLEGLGGRSLKESYEDLVVRVTQDVNVQAGVSDGLKNFYKTLEGKHLASSGVNLDEEAVKMIFYQRVYQANSKLIQASSEMLDVLVNL